MLKDDQSKIVADEMSQQVTKDTSEPGRREDITESESSNKRIALFPGKFKPPCENATEWNKFELVFDE